MSSSINASSGPTVIPTGSYWGGAGEQIDLLSGNLNYSLPLVTAVGHGGLKAAFGLSYNSQNWVNVSGVNRMLGADTGYGFGWQVMLGSVLPVWGPWSTSWTAWAAKLA